MKDLLQFINTIYLWAGLKRIEKNSKIQNIHKIPPQKLVQLYFQISKKNPNFFPIYSKKNPKKCCSDSNPVSQTFQTCRNVRPQLEAVLFTHMDSTKPDTFF